MCHNYSENGLFCIRNRQQRSWWPNWKSSNPEHNIKLNKGKSQLWSSAIHSNHIVLTTIDQNVLTITYNVQVELFYCSIVSSTCWIFHLSWVLANFNAVLRCADPVRRKVVKASWSCPVIEKSKFSDSWPRKLMVRLIFAEGVATN